MIKTIAILAAGALAALVIGDVIEVSWHPDRLGQLPSTLINTVASQEQLQQLGAAAQNLLARVIAVGLPSIISNSAGEVAGSKSEPQGSPAELAGPTPSPIPADSEPIPLKF